MFDLFENLIEKTLTLKVDLKKKKKRLLIKFKDLIKLLIGLINLFKNLIEEKLRLKVNLAKT